MRTLLTFTLTTVTVLGLAGCASTPTARKPAKTSVSYGTPIVTERPLRSDRNRAREARDAERAGTASTRVLGNFNR